MFKRVYPYSSIVYIIIIFLNIFTLHFNSHIIVLSQDGVYDRLQIDVIVDGTVHVAVYCYSTRLPFDIPYIPSLGMTPNYFMLECILGKGINCFIKLDLNAMGESEADVYAYKIIGIIEDWFNVRFNLTKRVPGSFNNPYTGLIKWVDYYFDTYSNLNYDVILDRFFEFKPNDGWMQIIKKEMMFQGDKIILMCYSGSSYGRLIIKKYFRNYFNFKAGNTYILDLFNLFNITCPLKFNSNSEVEIRLLIYDKASEDFSIYSSLQTIYSNLRAEIISVDVPFGYGVGIGTYADKPLPPTYTISINIKGGHTITSGTIVDRLKITFKIVEHGFKLFDITPVSLIGLFLVFVCVASITCIIIYRMHVKRG